MIHPPIYKAINENDLAKELKLAATDKDLATKFWQPLTNYSVNLILSSNYSQAQNLLRQLLHKCKTIDPNSYSKIHKGNPYYFLGIASYLMNDIETGTFFIDSAASEDLRYGADAIKDPKPSTLFLTLQGDNDHQFAKKLTQITESKVQRALNLYNSLAGHRPDKSDLTIANLRKKFLFPALSTEMSPGWRTLATVFISFFVEWDSRNELLDLRVRPGTYEPYYIHLLKGCILFESLLKNNPKYPKVQTKTKLDQLLEPLHSCLGISPKLKISGKKLPTLLTSLSHLKPEDETRELAIQYTGFLRNTLGHDLGWKIRLEKIQYQRCFQFVVSSCLHTIACLY